MRRRASWALLFAAGLIVGMAFSGVFDAPGPVLSAADTAAPTRNDLEELRDFAGKFETLFQTVAEQVNPAVVLVQAEKTVRVPQMDSFFRSPFDDLFPSPFGDRDPSRRRRQPREEERTLRGVGSGTILDKEGHILTNNHVVKDAEKLTVRLADDRTFDAEVVGIDVGTDLAVIRIVGDVGDLPTAVLGDSDSLRIGQWVLAIGNPLGLSHTVSAGIISATGRSGLGLARYESMIQTDAAINRGNSGGPLVNLRGELVGINTAIFSPTGGSIGIGFAIPVNMFKDIQDDLIEGREVVRGYLGVHIRDVSPDMAEAFEFEGTGGALVEEVGEDTPAEKAGFAAGDIIMEYDGEATDGANELQRRVTATDPDRQVKVKVWRDGKERTLTVKVGDLAAAPGEASDWLGLTVKTLTREAARELGEPEMEGVQVTEVGRESVGARYIQPGNVILSVNRQKVTSTEDYAEQMKKARAVGRVLLWVYDSRTGRSGHILLRGRPSR